MAASHIAIMDAVYALLQEKSVRDLTMEEVAKRAKVGKPTLYKWWQTKAALVLAMLCERMAPNLETPTILTAEESSAFECGVDRCVQRAFPRSGSSVSPGWEPFARRALQHQGGLSLHHL